MIGNKAEIKNNQIPTTTKEVSVINLLLKENPVAMSAFLIVSFVTFFFLFKGLKKFF